MKMLIIEDEGFAYIGPYTRRLDIETILFRSFCPSWGQVSDTSFAKEVIEMPGEDNADVIVNIAVDRQVDAVVSTACLEPLNLRDAKVQQILESKYGIPVIANPLATVETAYHKFRTSELFRKHNISTSDNGLAHSVGEALELAESLGYPVMIKKINGYSGMGLRLFENTGQLERYLGRRVKFPIMLERFLEGIEYSVEVLRYDNQSFIQVAIYKGHTTKNVIMHPIYRLQIAPNPLTNVPDERLFHVADMASSLLGIQGSADFDIIANRNEVKIIEVNPRIGGVTRLSAASTGVNTYEKLIDMALGKWAPQSLIRETNPVIELPITKELTADIIKQLQRDPDIVTVRTIDWMPVLPLTGKIMIRAATWDKALEKTIEMVELYSDPAYIDELERVLHVV